MDTILLAAELIYMVKRLQQFTAHMLQTCNKLLVCVWKACSKC